MGVGTLRAEMAVKPEKEAAYQKRVSAADENRGASDTNIKVPLISKIAYGMGDVGCNFSWMFVGNFLMINDIFFRISFF